VKPDISADRLERARARVEPLLDLLRRETNNLGAEDDSALIYVPDEAPEQ